MMQWGRRNRIDDTTTKKRLSNIDGKETETKFVLCNESDKDMARNGELNEEGTAKNRKHQGDGHEQKARNRRC